MFRYTIKDYKKEMLECSLNMPLSWQSTYLSENCKGLSKAEKRKVIHDLCNVYSGQSFKKGIMKGYINVIRKIYATHNKLSYKPLPKNIVTLEELKAI